jgi:hypothetical protein
MRIGLPVRDIVKNVGVLKIVRITEIRIRRLKVGNKNVEKFARVRFHYL